nr:MAG TPA: hypothetical protein [Caudoviricetes sp.]
MVIESDHIQSESMQDYRVFQIGLNFVEVIVMLIDRLVMLLPFQWDAGLEVRL